MPEPRDHASRRRGPAPVVGPVLAPLYALGLRARSRAFDQGRGVRTLPVPVISVGNLSVGGTGKTPMVAHLTELLLRHTFRPLIAMRGYTRSKSSTHAPDETDSYLRRFPAVPVVAQPDRAAGILSVLEQTPDPKRPNVVLLDDGFQHRQIARTLDLVLIDATHSPFDDKLLPAGWLREPVTALRRASGVVLTHVDRADSTALLRLVERLKSDLNITPIAGTRHLWTHLLLDQKDTGDRPLGLDWLLDKRVVGCCALGTPDGFVASLRTITRNPATPVLVLPDHDPFHEPALERLLALASEHRAQAIVVTDKDWSKLRHVDPARWPCPVVRPALALSFDPRFGAAETFENRILSALRTER